MKFRWLMVISLAFAGAGTRQQDVHSNQGLPPPVFSGVIKGGQFNQDSLMVFYFTDLKNDLVSNRKSMVVNIQESGEFSFALAPVNSIGKIFLQLQGHDMHALGPASNVIHYYVENGDSIYLEVTLHDDGTVAQRISGVGAQKYLAAKSVFKVPFVEDTFSYRYYEAQSDARAHIKQLIKSNFLRFDVMNQTLAYYKDLLPLDIYELFRSDVIGVNYSNLLGNVFAYYSKERWDLVDGAFLDSVMCRVKIDDAVLAKSEWYIHYVLNFEMLNTRVSNRSKQVLLSDMYSALKKRPNGILKDKLFAKYINDPFYRIIENAWIDESRTQPGIDRFEEIVQDVLAHQMSDSSLRKEILNTFSVLRKGSKVCDLPLIDREGNSVRVSDFKGKIVFINVYGPRCKGCIKFEKVLKEKVIPVFEGNRNLVFLSVSLEKNRKKWLNGILHDEIVGTNASYVPLWTEGLSSKHPFVKYYNIQVLPLILLVNKEGAIYNSSNDGLVISVSTDDLITMIQGALKGSGF